MSQLHKLLPYLGRVDITIADDAQICALLQQLEMVLSFLARTHAHMHTCTQCSLKSKILETTNTKCWSRIIVNTSRLIVQTENTPFASTQARYSLAHSPPPLTHRQKRRARERGDTGKKSKNKMLWILPCVSAFLETLSRCTGDTALFKRVLRRDNIVLKRDLWNFWFMPRHCFFGETVAQ